MKQKESASFEKAKRKAEKYEQDPSQTEKLTDDASSKAERYKKTLKEVWVDMQGFIRMVSAWRKGAYTKVPWKTMALIIAALIYFVNPIDAIFDMIPFIGFADDIAVIGFVANSVRGDVRKFMEWEAGNESAESDPETVVRNIAVE